MKKIILLTLTLINFACFAQYYNTDLPYKQGVYKPNWESLSSQYKCPEWFRDAKFGIWAHWGVQCVPGSGDWSGLFLYNPQRTKPKATEWYASNAKKISQYHLEHFGHPSEFGLKDYIPLFTAKKWNPDSLLKLYKKAGAKYFVAMGNHHDNFDNWNSKHQPWNSVNMGPKQDLIGQWSKAAKKQGLKFGVSIHAARSWKWLAPIFSSDTEGKYKGVPYDTQLTQEDGKGKWWQGYNPQDLYTKPHAQGEKADQSYVDKFYLRTIDLIDQYNPDLLYFDDAKAPLGGAGLKIYAHFYNTNLENNKGKLEAVINSKSNDKKTRNGLIEDVERGAKKDIYPTPWQTDTCIGGWHYNNDYTNGVEPYKSPERVIKMLVDIVSKNGNLLLSIPMRADGSIDEKEIAFLEGMTQWMEINSEGIYSTRPWKTFGEGNTNTKGGHFSDQNNAPLAYTQKDFRFTTKGNSLYVFTMQIPTDDILIKSLPLGTKKINSVKLLGSKQKIKWKQTINGLQIIKSKKYPTKHVACYQIN